MIVRPGKRLPIIVAGIAVLGLCSFVWPIVLWLAGVALLATAGLAFLDARRAVEMLKHIRPSRTLPGIVGRDLMFPVSLTLEHDGVFPVTGEIRDIFPAAAVPVWWSETFRWPAGVRTISFATTCRIPQRGKHSFGPIWIRVPGPSLLMEAQREFEQRGEVKVLPETFVAPEMLQQDPQAEQLQLDKVALTRQQGAGAEFVTLDEYRRGDDPRRIDWRATARHGFLIVRRFQVERHRDVMILIDSGRLMGASIGRGSKLDFAVDSALNLARTVLEGGDRCGIGYFDNLLRGYLPPVAGLKSLRHLADCVYDIQSNWQETDYSRVFAEMQRRQSKRCLLVVLSDLSDAETSRMHCAALERLNRRHLVLLAAIRTPLIDRVVRHKPATILEGARQAVAMGLDRDRGRALHSLRHGGVRVLDAAPQQLTIPLINLFLNLRRQNLL